ncbi:hypothetical protein [Peribacillus frigoritolerans]|uniref:hypothetical protein n=1 Tax=Peribacillus frigoritolerans TaxID=450367 RepID=UPI003F7DF220
MNISGQMLLDIAIDKEASLSDSISKLIDEEELKLGENQYLIVHQITKRNDELYTVILYRIEY